jgi:hypothetical protein
MTPAFFRTLTISALLLFIAISTQADTIQTKTYSTGGTSTQIIKTYFDSAGKVTREEYDTNADGTIDKVKTCTYQSGRLVSEETRTYGTNVLLCSSAYAYDTSGRQLSLVVDTNGDSTVELSYTYSYSGSGDKDFTLTSVEYGVTKFTTSGSAVQ